MTTDQAYSLFHYFPEFLRLRRVLIELKTLSSKYLHNMMKKYGTGLEVKQAKAQMWLGFPSSQLNKKRENVEEGC